MRPTCGDSVLVRRNARWVPAVYVGEKGKRAVVAVKGEGARLRDLPPSLVILVLN